MLCRHCVLTERGSEALELFRGGCSDEFVVLTAGSVVQIAVRGPAVARKEQWRVDNVTESGCQSIVLQITMVRHGDSHLIPEPMMSGSLTPLPSSEEPPVDESRLRRDDRPCSLGLG